MSEIEYRPDCYLCRLKAGKADANILPDQLCVVHLITTRQDMRAEIAALKAEREKKGKCEWRENEDGLYLTGCGEAYFFDSGTATENKARFCQFCGKRLKDIRYKKD